MKRGGLTWGRSSKIFHIGRTMKFAKQKPEATVMDISPTLAKRNATGNKPMETAVCAGWYIDLLAASMKRRKWRVTSQGIGFASASWQTA